MNTGYVMLSLDKKIPTDKVYVISEKLKEIPDCKAAEIMAYSGLKDPITSLLLGVFLGGLGAHNFYLGDKKKGITFAVFFSLSIFMLIISLVFEYLGLLQFARGMEAFEFGEAYPDESPYFLIVGYIMLIISLIFIGIVAIAGLIDGVLSYRRTQEKNFLSILATIESVK